MPSLALDDKTQVFVCTALTGLYMNLGTQEDIVQNGHHHLDVINRNYQKPPRTAFPT